MNSFSDTYEVRHTRPAASLARRPETPDPQISTRPGLLVTAAEWNGVAQPRKSETSPVPIIRHDHHMSDHLPPVLTTPPLETLACLETPRRSCLSVSSVYPSIHASPNRPPRPAFQCNADLLAPPRPRQHPRPRIAARPQVPE